MAEENAARGFATTLVTERSEIAEKQAVGGFTTALVMEVPDGHSDEFEEAWAKAADQVADMDGNIHQVLLRPTHLEHTYVVISKWRDEETFHEFERSDVQHELTATLRRLREGIVMSTPIAVSRVEGRNP